jgi:hypothetical protein
MMYSPMYYRNAEAIANAIKSNRMFSYIGTSRQQWRTIQSVQLYMREPS